jgi:hypothetical protein
VSCLRFLCFLTYLYLPYLGIGIILVTELVYVTINSLNFRAAEKPVNKRETRNNDIAIPIETTWVSLIFVMSYLLPRYEYRYTGCFACQVPLKLPYGAVALLGSAHAAQLSFVQRRASIRFDSIGLERLIQQSIRGPAVCSMSRARFSFDRLGLDSPAPRRRPDRGGADASLDFRRASFPSSTFLSPTCRDTGDCRTLVPGCVDVHNQAFAVPPWR